LNSPACPVERTPAGDAREHRTRLLFDQGVGALGVSVAVAVAAAVLLWPVAGGPGLAAWLALVVAVALARISLILAWHRAPRTAAQVLRWRRLYLAGAALGGLSWGMLGLLIDPGLPLPFQVTVLVVMAVVATAAIATNAVVLPAYLAFLLAVLLPLEWRLLGLAGEPHHSMAGIVALFGFSLFVTARSYSDRVAQSLSLAETLARTCGDLEAEAGERSRAEGRVARVERLFMEGPVVAFRWSAEDGWPIEGVSPNVAQFGLDAAQLTAARQRYADLIHPDDLGAVQSGGLSAAGPSGLRFFEGDYRLRLPGGEVRWVYDYTVSVHDEHGRLTHYDGYLLDISDRKRMEEALREEKELAEVTLHSIADGVVRTDEHQRVTYLNPVAEQLTGWPLEEARGRALDEVLVLEDASPHSSDTFERAGWSEIGHRLLRARDGSRFAVSQSVAAIRDGAGSMRGGVWVLHDVSETRLLAQSLAYQATHDALTGLLNRREFEGRLRNALRSARSDGLQHVCIYLDLDQFKVVNDTCGHSAGDDLLRQLPGLLQSGLRESDALARLGGDEFGVLLEGCSVPKAVQIAEQLRERLREYRFLRDGKTFVVGASFGIVGVTALSGSVENVLSAADLACYAAKDLGRNRIHVYEASDADLVRRQGEMHWITRITEAMAQERLELHRQPIRPAVPSAQAPAWDEVLLRLRDEDGRLNSAHAFLPAAERYNLAPQIDRWVVERCFAWQHARGGNGAVLGINLSGATLSDERFLDYIRERLAHWGIAPSDLCFEITETAAIGNFRNASRFITELTALGCRFALDDFGSGLSSFAYLKNFPVDYLKIDGTFVRDMLNDPLDRAMVAAIIDVGRIMGIRTVAEQVENQATLQALGEMGVDFVQGNGIAEPGPMEGIPSGRATG
jgi:diguanylate cyclase (GGDEF)-like protein/PAS domain S-box-containing protein